MGKLLLQWYRTPVVLITCATLAIMFSVVWMTVSSATPATGKQSPAAAAEKAKTVHALPEWHAAHVAMYRAQAPQSKKVSYAPANKMTGFGSWSGPSPHSAPSLVGGKTAKTHGKFKDSRIATVSPPRKDGGNKKNVKAADSKQEESKKEESKEPKHTVDSSPATYVGSAKCITCHVSQAETFAKTSMGRIFLKNPRSQHEKLGCEACHGPGSVHVAKGGAEDDGAESIFSYDEDSPRSIPDRNAKCLTCHENDARTHWKGSVHEARNLACTSCHQIMDKASPRFQLIKATETETCTQCHKDRKAQLWRSSHMPVREGKLNCTSCHNPHGTANQNLLKEATVNETCYSCHADKRGPFLFEHAPARDNCLSCHEPHGSIHEKLLTVSRPRLCQQCHSEGDHPSESHGPRELFAFNRGCANCHGGMQHGSNSPSGAQLHR